jgi:hypothetical protein
MMISSISKATSSALVLVECEISRLARQFTSLLVLESPVKKPEKDRGPDLTLTGKDRKICNRYRPLTAVRLTVCTFFISL